MVCYSVVDDLIVFLASSVQMGRQVMQVVDKLFCCGWRITMSYAQQLVKGIYGFFFFGNSRKEYACGPATILSRPRLLPGADLFVLL